MAIQEVSIEKVVSVLEYDHITVLSAQMLALSNQFAILTKGLTQGADLNTVQSIDMSM